MVQVITLGKDVIGIYSTYKGEGYQNSAREIVETPGKIFDTVLLDALNTKVMLKDRVTSVLGGNTRTGYEYSDDIIAGQRIEGYSTSMLLALKAYEQDLSLF